MPRTIISDTSCFILLAKIGELDLLQKVYGKVLTTKEVASEYGEALPEWVEIKDAANKQLQRILEVQIDKGEASAIALAMEIPESIIILDDQKARKIAQKIGLEFTGTVGVIVKAKIRGIISSIRPMLDKIKATNFRLTDDLELQALKEAKEIE